MENMNGKYTPEPLNLVILPCAQKTRIKLKILKDLNMLLENDNRGRMAKLFVVTKKQIIIAFMIKINQKKVQT